MSGVCRFGHDEILSNLRLVGHIIFISIFIGDCRPASNITRGSEEDKKLSSDSLRLMGICLVFLSRFVRSLKVNFVLHKKKKPKS